MKSKLVAMFLLYAACSILMVGPVMAQGTGVLGIGANTSGDRLQGVMAPVLAASPMPVNFGNVLVNTEMMTRELTVENLGDEDLLLNSIAVVGHDAALFAIAPTVYTDPVAPGASITLTVSLIPPANPANVFTTIEISSNGGDVVVPVVGKIKVPGTYYVSPSGDNTNPGTKAEPWKTIQFAAHELIPGDVVLVEDGVYQESVVISRSGTPDAYVTMKSLNRWGAKIEITNGMGAVDGIKSVANYVIIDGFEIYDTAPDFGHHGNGVTVYENHHVIIRNNKIHDFGGSGIQGARFDHIHIENNIIYNNAKYNPNQPSGISLWQARAVDDAPGYHAIIRNNRSYGNMNLVPLGSAGTKDGNGILIDDFRNSAGENPSNINYTPRTLIENNVVYDNGGKGIQVFKSDNVDVFNNTAYHNNYDLQNEGTWRAELSLITSTGTVWRNNIGVANPGEGILAFNRAMLISKGGDTVWENNITFNGTPDDISALIDNQTVSETYIRENNQMGVDPMFTDPAGFDFSLRAESPAVDSGSDQIVSFFDVDYWSRSEGFVDIGAFEFGNPNPGLPVELTAFDAVVSGTSILLYWTTASELNNSGFAVELAAAGRDFEQVMFVAGQGTTDQEQTYETSLADLAPGAYTVRLKQIDFDGTFAYSDPVAVVVLAEDYHLAQSYPNPFNPQTRIQYTLPVAGHVTLEVFDLLGRSIRMLVQEPQAAGTHAVVFDAGDLPNGTYVYRLTAGSFSETRTMVLMK